MASVSQNQEGQARLGVFDAICIILGIIIGATIYETPPFIFRLIGDPWLTLALWAGCGLLALIGALCYAELATTYPRSGGDYVYLTRAFGPFPGYLFAWAQLAVVQTGSIGLMAYVFADYAKRLHDKNPFLDQIHVDEFHVPAVFAAAAIIVITLLNILGVVMGKIAQDLLTLAKVVGLGAIIVAGFAYPDKTFVEIEGKFKEATAQQIVVEAGSESKTFTAAKDVIKPADYVRKESIKDDEGKDTDKFKETGRQIWILAKADSPTEAIKIFAERDITFGLFAFPLVLILLAYGGWNDAAFVAAEVRNPGRNIPLALIIGTAGVAIIYCTINYAYIHGLGFMGAVDSKQIAADLLKRLPWEHGELAMIILVMVSALGAVNGLTYTSSRIYSTLGKDYSLFAPLGSWNRIFGTPIWSLLLQMVISLAMVLGAGTKHGREYVEKGIVYVSGANPDWEGVGGFEGLLKCTAPIFWVFFLMTGLAFFVLRINDSNVPRPFRLPVPLFPILPLIFCTMCGYMLHSTVFNYSGKFGLVGGVLVLAGIPFYVFSRRRPHSDAEMPGSAT